MKRESNPPLNVGDQVMCYHMEGEMSVPPGTLGIVNNVSRDPFEHDEFIYSVNWENGSNLSIISSTDIWKKVLKKNIQEQKDSQLDFISKNPDIFRYFDWRWFKEYLKNVRDSGIVNMYNSSHLLYSGKNYITTYYSDNEDNEGLYEVLNDAEKSKDKIIQGVLKYMDENKKDTDNLELINRYVIIFSKKLVELYIATY